MSIHYVVVSAIAHGEQRGHRDPRHDGAVQEAVSAR